MVLALFPLIFHTVPSGAQQHSGPTSLHEGRFRQGEAMKPAYKKKYPHLFSPMPVGRKGQIVYKNRILVPPMGPTGDGVDSHNRINPDGVKFYTQFACGGFAGITASTGVLLNAGHRGFQTLDADVDGFVYMHNMQRGVHMYGAHTLCELYHPGCCTLPESG